MTATRHTTVDVRRLTPLEWPEAFPVISQLRMLDEAEFLRRACRQSYSGYELVGAFIDGKIIGVMGMRPVHTLARGGHLHIDDLVVAKDARGHGIGHALMQYAEADARARNMSAVFLDARPDAIPFYEREDYVPHSSPSMKKML
jgi:GNAT superfamily N-acetyltransferase